MIHIPRTFGALLLGGLYASLLSGIVVVQVVVYFKLYPADSRQVKSLVLVVWLLDTSHTAFIWSALWSYLIEHYGNAHEIDVIHWDLALTIVMTAILTFMVHLFFASRIFMLSKRNYLLTAPIVILAVLRLVSASVTTTEMLHYGTFSKFRHEIKWIFTAGLSLSTTVDILITGSLFVLLQTSRTGAANLNAVIDSLIKYAFETGLLTCAGTVISMLCWLTMPTNLIFMGLHFIIGKFYANSLLVTLNMRQSIRRGRSMTSKEYTNGVGISVHVLRDPSRRGRRTNNNNNNDSQNGSEGQFAVRDASQTEQPDQSKLTKMDLVPSSPVSATASENSFKTSDLKSPTVSIVEVNVQRSVQYM